MKTDATEIIRFLSSDHNLGPVSLSVSDWFSELLSPPGDVVSLHLVAMQGLEILHMLVGLLLVLPDVVDQVAED